MRADSVFVFLVPDRASDTIVVALDHDVRLATPFVAATGLVFTGVTTLVGGGLGMLAARSERWTPVRVNR